MIDSLYLEALNVVRQVMHELERYLMCLLKRTSIGLWGYVPKTKVQTFYS